jgi:hypothetical protein
VKKTEDGLKLRIYEHKKTNQSFMVIDPELKLDELEHVQEHVVALLSGQIIHEDEPVLPLNNTRLSVSPVRRPKRWKRHRYSTRYCY